MSDRPAWRLVAPAIYATDDPEVVSAEDLCSEPDLNDPVTKELWEAMNGGERLKRVRRVRGSRT